MKGIHLKRFNFFDQAGLKVRISSHAVYCVAGV